MHVLLCCFMYNVYMYNIMLYVCLCTLQCGRTALPNTGVENYKSINQVINQSINHQEQARDQKPVGVASVSKSAV